MTSYYRLKPEALTFIDIEITADFTISATYATRIRTREYHKD